MRRPRLKAPDHFVTAIYHCVSRVVDRQIVLHEAEKEQFVRLMRMYERFCGVRVITFCVMGNHFHVLVEVPKRPEVMMSDDELVAHVRRSKGKKEAANLASWFKLWREQGNVHAIEAERARHFRQMWDVSYFMKLLKQRFTQWFNGTRPTRRTGTLWEDRFRSVLVESGEALRAMAAYIDLNPIRANMVSDPKDYRWSGYGEACAGLVAAKNGLQRVLDGLIDEGVGVEGGVMEWYRMQLAYKGQRVLDDEGAVARAGFSPEEVRETEAKRGTIPVHEYLRLRVRYFTDGAVLGTREFVNGIFEAKRQWFSATRKTGARTLKGLGRASPLRTMRALVKEAVGRDAGSA